MAKNKGGLNIVEQLASKLMEKIIQDINNPNIINTDSIADIKSTLSVIMKAKSELTK